MYHIIGYQTNPITGETQYQILCDTVADLPISPVSDNGYGGEIGQGSKAVVIADGSSYLADSNRQWIYQPNPNAWVNVYTKLEIDEMITEIYETIAYYHTTLVSDNGEITFYAFAGYIGTWSIFGNGSQTGTPTPDNPVMPEFVGKRTSNLAQWEKGGINTTNGADEAYRTASQGGTCEQLRTLYTPCSGNTSYVLHTNHYPVQTFVSFYDIDKNYISRTSGTWQGENRAFTTPETARYMRAQLAHVVSDQIYPALVENPQFSITLGDTALPYEPYGYKIPISCGGETNNVYLSAPLRKAIDGTDAVDTLESTGIVTRNVDENGNALATPTTETVNVPDIPTVKGENTLTVDTILKPSRIEIQG